MKQHNVADVNMVEVNEAQVIKMDAKDTKSLLHKNQMIKGKVKGVRIL